MIIVEGGDGCGKTTLVHHLADKFGLAVGERGVANRDLLYKVTRQDTYTALAAAVKADQAPLIWDRLWISEYVYHDIKPGRPCEFSDYDTHFIRELIDLIGCPIIVCLPPYEVVKENALRVHQMEGVKENLPDIYMAYDSCSLPWPENTLWYDYTGETSHFATLEDIYEEVEGYLNHREARSSAWTS